MLNSVDADPQLIAGWQPFFAVSAGAAAALAGLLFVALSIHAQEIAEHPPFRYRALATLSIPLVVLVVSGLALLPRQTRFLGFEELVPLVLQGYGVLAWFRQARASAQLARGYGLRTAVGVAFIILAILGALLLFVGLEIGLGFLALFCLISLVWMAFNSWALLFAIADAEKLGESPPVRTDPASERVIDRQ